MTAFGDVPMVVRAMKSGAKDFIIKPFNNQELIESVIKCFSEAVHLEHFQNYQNNLNLLTPKEHKVLQLILEGYLNKQIADKLSMSISNIEVHRATIMKKMNAKNLAHLIKIYLHAQKQWI